MRHKWLLFFGVLCVFQICRTASAQLMNSVKLREFCQNVSVDSSQMSNSKIDDAEKCLFYVAGVSDGYLVASGTSRICPPKNGSVTYAQMALIVSKYLNDHPEKLNNDPEYLILDALYGAFPCPLKPTNK